MPPFEKAGSQKDLSGDRRAPAERRLSILGAVWQSSFARRRLGPRRDTDRHPVMTDWFQPQWLATAMIILILSSVDAVLTLALISRGAIEINPFMEPLVRGSGHSFAYWKLGLTSMGVVVLTMAARLRIFGRIAVGSLLYVILGGHLVLVGYEISLLRSIPGHYLPQGRGRRARHDLDHDLPALGRSTSNRNLQQRHQHERHDVDNLDQRVDRRPRGVLVGIANRVAGHHRPVRNRTCTMTWGQALRCKL